MGVSLNTLRVDLNTDGVDLNMGRGGHVHGMGWTWTLADTNKQ